MRLIAVADTCDVLVFDRPYRKARTLAESSTILREESGKHLDPTAVAALLGLLGKPDVAQAA